MEEEQRVLSPSVVQVMDSLGRNRGGLTKAVFERFRLLSTDRDSYLVTVAFQPDVHSIFEELVTDGTIPRHTKLLSFHETLREVNRESTTPVDTPHLFWQTDNAYNGAVEPTKSGEMTRYFHKGSFVGLLYKDNDGSPRHADHHDPLRPWVRISRDTFWPDGTVALRNYYDENNKTRFRVYVGSDARPYLSVWVTPEGYEYRTIMHSADRSDFCGDTRGANSAWLDSQLALIGPAVVFNDEPRTNFALSIGSPNIRHVASIHSTHYENNRDNSDGLKHWVSPYLTNVANTETLVFFTNTQREDFVRDTKFPYDQTAVISHAAPLAEARECTRSVERLDQEFVVVSRLAADKRLDHVIRAFALVREQNIEAKLRIYGTGPAEASLKSLANELLLESSVSFEGHTSKPLEAFAKAQVSLITSKFEGFGLVITESFACATPVIAYDVIYGPRDIVNSSNGFLVEDGDIRALSLAMTSILEDHSLRSSLGKGALDTAAAFTKSMWELGWKTTMTIEN